jgi:transcriptional regulator with PAS, ATPase and Fis domain
VRESTQLNFSTLQSALLVLMKNVPILIRGETGTGKELMARYAHAVSNRQGDFVAVNCAALPETLIESELFGYQDGAFSGAIRGGSKGLVRQANRGTLFLDEIATMPAQVQVKLLRFLDRMEIRPVGNTREIQLDIQLISATNAVLKCREQTDDFRPDLLYRINTMEVCLPARQELQIIRAAYERNSGNISAIARELGISRNTVYKKLKEAGKI